MDVMILPAHLSGAIKAPSSKSIAQRYVILAALADRPTFIALESASQDIASTVRCVRALGARVEVVSKTGGPKDTSTKTATGLLVGPLPRDPSGNPVALTEVELNCGESGATLRFLLPVVGGLGAEATFIGTGRLPQRPLKPLMRLLEEHGIQIKQKGPKNLPLTISGHLKPGRFMLTGNVSSQFISGLLLASPLLNKPVEVRVQDPFESRPYVALTTNALKRFGVEVITRRLDSADDAEAPLSGAHLEHATAYQVPGNQTLKSPREIEVEGDWSQAAFWLAAGALGASIEVQGLDLKSAQGDRAVLAALALLGVRVNREPNGCRTSCERPRAATFDLSDTPDLVPPLAAVVAVAEGTSTITGVKRLRIKESDRLESITSALNALGANAIVENDSLVIEGVEEFTGGEVDAAGDHRVAMMAAICAVHSKKPVIIHGAECVRKSYPSFFEAFSSLGGEVQEA